MASSAFSDRSREPGEKDIADVLGGADSLWRELKLSIASEFDGLVEEWVYSGKNYGWSLRLKQKKRAILYMTPLEQTFRVSLAFGEKAVQAAHQSDLPSPVLCAIDSAPKYPEGRAVRMEITGAEDIRIAARLSAIKMAN